MCDVNHLEVGPQVNLCKWGSSSTYRDLPAVRSAGCCSISPVWKRAYHMEQARRWEGFMGIGLSAVGVSVEFRGSHKEQCKLTIKISETCVLLVRLVFWALFLCFHFILLYGLVKTFTSFGLCQCCKRTEQTSPGISMVAAVDGLKGKVPVRADTELGRQGSKVIEDVFA